MSNVEEQPQYQDGESSLFCKDKKQEDIDPDILKRLVFEQDVSKLSSKQLLQYVNRLCSDLGINPLAQPFQLLKLQGKTQLYATKNCTDQLRHVFRISIVNFPGEEIGDIYQVTAQAKMPLKDGTVRVDMDLGVVSIKGLSGDAKANAIMRAGTKAKRRVTLSMIGLSKVMDETELETVPGVQTMEFDPSTGEVSQSPPEKTKQTSKGHSVQKAKDSGAREEAPEEQEIPPMALPETTALPEAGTETEPEPDPDFDLERDRLSHPDHPDKLFFPSAKCLDHDTYWTLQDGQYGKWWACKTLVTSQEDSPTGKSIWCNAFKTANDGKPVEIVEGNDRGSA